MCKVRSKTAVLTEYCSQPYHPRRLPVVRISSPSSQSYLPVSYTGKCWHKKSDCGDTSLLTCSSLGYKLIKKGVPILPRVVPSARSVSFVRRICFRPRRLLNFQIFGRRCSIIYCCFPSRRDHQQFCNQTLLIKGLKIGLMDDVIQEFSFGLASIVCKYSLYQRIFDNKGMLPINQCIFPIFW